jgi:hypothetical protein
MTSEQYHVSTNADSIHFVNEVCSAFTVPTFNFASADCPLRALRPRVNFAAGVKRKGALARRYFGSTFASMRHRLFTEGKLLSQDG